MRKMFMKTTFITSLFAVILLFAGVADAAIIKLTKTYRCAVLPTLITYMNPHEVYTSGMTRFSDVFYPIYLETNDIGEMDAFIENAGIIYIGE